MRREKYFCFTSLSSEQRIVAFVNYFEGFCEFLKESEIEIENFEFLKSISTWDKANSKHNTFNFMRFQHIEILPKHTK
jgi:hypothetical protein